jgi:hypothetical protein
MENKTQRRIHKYFFSHYFCFVFFRKNFIRGNAATNNTPNEGGKFHRGKVKEVETFHYFVAKCNPFQQKKRLGVKFNQFLMMTKSATLNTIYFPQPLSRLNCVVFSDFAFF